MLIAEAKWFSAQLAHWPNEALSPLLNLGSQSLAFRTRRQPWLERFVFTPLRTRGVEVVHSDIEGHDGVDLVGDLTDPGFRAQLRRRRFRSVICSNLLEHVVGPAEFAGAVAESVEPGGLLFLSVPYRFPHHADPIDTMFRPTPAELAHLFPRTELVAERILRCGNLTTYALGRLFASPRAFFEDALGGRPRGNGPVTAPPSHMAMKQGSQTLHSQLQWLILPFRVTCLTLRTQPT